MLRRSHFRILRVLKLARRGLHYLQLNVIVGGAEVLDVPRPPPGGACGT